MASYQLDISRETKDSIVFFALAFRKLHFKCFIDNTPIPESVVLKLNELFANPSPQGMEELKKKKDVIHFLVKYEKFTQ